MYGLSIDIVMNRAGLGLIARCEQPRKAIQHAASRERSESGHLRKCLEPPHPESNRSACGRACPEFHQRQLRHDELAALGAAAVCQTHYCAPPAMSVDRARPRRSYKVASLNSLQQHNLHWAAGSHLRSRAPRTLPFGHHTSPCILPTSIPGTYRPMWSGLQLSPQLTVSSATVPILPVSPALSEHAATLPRGPFH
jgi:hypothetical protein